VYYSPPGIIGPGVNYFSLPALPGDGTPESIKPAVVFAGLPIQNKVAYWCRMDQRWHVYPTDMSLVYWHMGHRLEVDQRYTIRFEGTQPAAEQSTCLNPLQPGLAFISQPYVSAAFWADFEFSSKRFPGQRFTTAQAVAMGWIEPYLVEGALDSGVRITLDGAGGTSTRVRPWRAYWVTTKVGPSEHELMIYWPTQAAPTAGADFDYDGDVDADDFEIFEACATGPGVAPPPDGCAYVDLDADADVDQSDFAVIQACLSGPGSPADPACTRH